MHSGLWRELRYLISQKWDLALVTLAPLMVIILLTQMFAQGKPSHLPIAVIDQDHSSLSQHIQRHLALNHTLQTAYVGTQMSDAERLLNQNKIWGYVHIPAGAEQRLVKLQDANISIAYNQSYFSIGNSIASAMLISNLRGIAEFSGQDYLKNSLPDIDAPTPNIKISALYNPELNYELYLEPYMFLAILHLLLCCCVAFSVGQEIKRHTLAAWLNQQSLWAALLSKNLIYIAIFCVWTWVWLFWMVEIRGWFIAGNIGLILIGQVLLFSAYAFLSSAVVLATRDLSKSFGLLAVYGGSSLSFAGVTLPLNNAPVFTQFWSSIIPFTPYAKLQTEQWLLASPLSVSIIPLLLLAAYALAYASLAYVLLRKIAQGVA